MYLRLRCLRFAVGLVLLPFTCQAQDVFKVEEISRAGGTISIRFSDTRAVELTGTYGLEARGSLAPSNQWTNSSGAVFSVLGGNEYLVTAPENADISFFRILSLGALDTDSDGVPDAVEEALGTNPNVPDWIQDTDLDGFSDGLEIVNGSDPGDINSRIQRGLQPSVQFAEFTSRALEGGGTISIPIQADAGYSGQVYYTLSVMSTAGVNVDFSHPQNGVVTVQGGTGSIPLTIVDDLEVENMEAIVLNLEDDTAGTYHTGAFPTHTVLLIDNDANWSGLLQSSVGETSFRLCVQRSATEVSAMLIPSPKVTADHLGGQLIPLPPGGQSGWPVTNVLLTSTEFTGQSVSMPAGSSKFLGGTELVRRFSFSAQPPPDGVTNVLYISKTNATFGALVIAGEYTEVLAPAQPDGFSMQFTNRGSFFLAREAPIMTPLEIPTTPAP